MADIQKQVIVFPRGQLSASDRERIRKIVVVAVEADDPSKVVTVIPFVPLETSLDPDHFAMALLHAVNQDPNRYAQGRFVEELHRRMLAREKAKEPQP